MIRLPESVAKIVVLIGPIKNVPDVAIEPGPVSRIPAETTRAPVNQGRLVAWRNVLRIVEGARSAIEIGALGKLANGHVFDYIVHGDYVQNLGHVRRICTSDPGRILNINVANCLDQLREHNQTRHHWTV